MATGKKFYWMKLKASFMTSETVDFIMSRKNGAQYVVLYQMLCLKTINTGGRLSTQIGEIIIPFDIEKIQRDFKWFSIDTIRVALELYRQLGLIYEDFDGTLVLTDHKSLIGSGSDWAEKKARQRKEIESRNSPRFPESSSDFCETGGDIVPTNVPQNVPIENRDKILDIRDKNIERKDIDIKNALSAEELPQSCPFSQIKDLYHSICKSYRKITDIDGERRKAVFFQWCKHKSLSAFENLFKKAEYSDFLKGRNERNWTADFDWMMKPDNFRKIIEGKYDNNLTVHSGHQEPSYDLEAWSCRTIDNWEENRSRKDET